MNDNSHEQSCKPYCPKCGGRDFHTGFAENALGKEVEAICCENFECDWACEYKTFEEYWGADNG